MKNFLYVVIAILMLAAHAAKASEPKTLTIGLDVSASAPILKSQIYADLAAERAAQAVRGLTFGDTVIVQKFGERRLDNLRAVRIVITPKARPERVSAAIAKLIRDMPGAGTQGQQWTNIARFLTVGRFGCEAGGEVLLITDGIESSQAVNAKQVLAGRAALPAPDAGMLKGCTVTMFGLGVAADGALSPGQINALRAAWADWMQIAKARFVPVELQ